MRPGQQNKRGRGRNNNNNGGNNNTNFNRKGGNPLTRSYDSSGPDVKIRGTAQHIAEKYTQLARDAQSAGDRVMAENYLQHAEHYNRIIDAAQAQMQERYQRDDRAQQYDRETTERDDDMMDDGETDTDMVAAPEPRSAPVREVFDGSGPQPVIEGIPAEMVMDEAPAAVEASEDRQPRRRNTGPRPRRQPRRVAGEGDAASTSTEAPALVAAETE